MQIIKKVPIITTGRYAGTPINKLPNSYLRWMISQNFPKEWVECAREKLEKSNYSDIHLNISRHAIDMYSKRFLWKWIQSENDKGDAGDGLATFITKSAEIAWEKGTDVSKRRHQDDGVIKEWRGIKWVFSVSPDYPDYKDVITVMSSVDEEVELSTIIPLTNQL